MKVMKFFKAQLKISLYFNPKQVDLILTKLASLVAHRDICLSNHFKIVQLLTEAVLSSCDFIMKESNNACF